ncbi:hypothetical protein [Bosea sp. (in: a-proteobacteria)]|uniref:hypothetical protein n=1 Tax=Bosea sp. (in: a-proteobacteria) TaxID=1871050 RepID=UPI002618CCEC|nr:hypothetical protein [Bosea sp. (in: a-proteobacteria)]MCO5090935.1 hypothetical protein [Bosea sp. (in: a-proteobacteria)]
MKLQTWVYPWDIHAGGVDRVLGEIRDLGLTGIELTSNYHAIATLAARGEGRRVLYTEHGGVFFPARAERYGRIKPEVWPDDEIVRIWPEVSERSAKLGLRLNAWTIGQFQPWITRQVPECSKVLPTGDRVPATTCPCNTDVQEFFCAMGADLSSQFPVDLIELEGIGFHKFQYGWVRPRILIDIAPWTEWLLSLCFCESCKARARRAGLDPDGLQARVRIEIERCFNAQSDTDPAGPLEEMRAAWLDRDPDLAGYLQCREDAVVDLVRNMADAVGEASQARLGVWAPVEVDGSEGVKLERVVDKIGAVIVWHPEMRREEAARIRRLTAAATPRVELTHFQASGWPHGPTSPGFRAELEAAIANAVDQISFYNYGLMRRWQLKEMVALARSLTTR